MANHTDCFVCAILRTISGSLHLYERLGVKVGDTLLYIISQLGGSEESIGSNFSGTPSQLRTEIMVSLDTTVTGTVDLCTPFAPKFFSI
jgi:hypothetical protein